MRVRAEVERQPGMTAYWVMFTRDGCEERFQYVEGVGVPSEWKGAGADPDTIEEGRQLGTVPQVRARSPREWIEDTLASTYWDEDRPEQHEIDRAVEAIEGDLSSEQTLLDEADESHEEAQGLRRQVIARSEEPDYDIDIVMRTLREVALVLGDFDENVADPAELSVELSFGLDVIEEHLGKRPPGSVKAEIEEQLTRLNS